jgi:hypothetical protein
VAEKSGRLMNVPEYHFGGIRFEYPEDFVKELRPTKWSIRKFMAFARSLDIIERNRFVDHVLKMLPEYFTDKETGNFVREIKKRTTYFPDNKPAPLPVDPERENELIQAFARLKKDGTIKASATALANLLKNQFGVKYSLPTIRDKIYIITGEN